MEDGIGPDEKKPGEQKREEKLYMVVIMGVTGAGKSYFVNRLAGRQVAKEGNSLHACAFRNSEVQRTASAD
jgi:hypothetical protein